MSMPSNPQIKVENRLLLALPTEEYEAQYLLYSIETCLFNICSQPTPPNKSCLS
ncbi:hypothetical protein [Iningainema tapete]|uniref:Uncharacterized protein n=1 Tax=Iningainema tapete BLCC-T55 TaxID=2748662 RepID=A0A8J7BY43_9CYAN|nr:hypothetical protein [Iningainema tapete]MBD2775007.1 hypothetical protein [Iningainema tapete BLCC-T55]